MRKNAIIILAVAAVLIAVALYQNLFSADQRAATALEEGPKPGFAAPSFELASLDGQTYSIGGARDKPVLINFWASWCEPCHQEAPDLQQIYEQYAGKLDIYAVNVTSLDTERGAREFINEYELTFPALLDLDGAVASSYRVNGYPVTFLVGSDGVVADAYFGMIIPADVTRQIDRLLQ